MNPNSQKSVDGWKLYCEAFRALFGDAKIELSAVALYEMADRLAAKSDGPSGEAEAKVEAYETILNRIAEIVGTETPYGALPDAVEAMQPPKRPEAGAERSK